MVASTEFKGEGRSRFSAIKNVLYPPALRKNLFSLGRAMKQWNSARFAGGFCTVRNSEGVEILNGSGHAGLFKLNVRVMPPELSC